MTATKFDSEKIKMQLVSPYYIEGTAAVLTFGAQKYAAFNWGQGMSYQRVYGALQRHLSEWYKGNSTDAETGLSHLYHASCCLMFLSEFERAGLYWKNDDRYDTSLGNSLFSKHSVCVSKGVPAAVSNPQGAEVNTSGELPTSDVRSPNDRASG